MGCRYKCAVRRCPFLPISPRASVDEAKPTKRYMNIAEGSLKECRYYLILAHDLGYGDTDALNAALEETSRLLNAYSAAILTSGS